MLSRGYLNLTVVLALIAALVSIAYLGQLMMVREPDSWARTPPIEWWGKVLTSATERAFLVLCCVMGLSVLFSVRKVGLMSGAVSHRLGWLSLGLLGTGLARLGTSLFYAPLYVGLSQNGLFGGWEWVSLVLQKSQVSLLPILMAAVIAVMARALKLADEARSENAEFV